MPAYLSTLPAFLTWFGIGAALTTVYASVYLWLTPWREVELIRRGNVAAAISLAGALGGYAMAIGSVMSHSTSRGDLASWGIVAFGVQVLAFLMARVLLGKGLKERIEAGDLASGIMLATISIVAGILNSSAMTY